MREAQNQTTMSYQLTLVRMAKTQKTTNASNHVDKGEHKYVADGIGN